MAATPSVFIEVFVVFSVLPDKNVEIVPLLGHDPFLTETFKLIVLQS